VSSDQNVSCVGILYFSKRPLNCAIHNIIFSCLSVQLMYQNYLFFSTDEDSNGEIDKEELKHCFHKLAVSFTEEEITDLFEACDMNEDMGMKFNEFIVFLCLVYLLNEPAVSEAVSFITRTVTI
jgi:hypothetical protein